MEFSEKDKKSRLEKDPSKNLPLQSAVESSKKIF